MYKPTNREPLKDEVLKVAPKDVLPIAPIFLAIGGGGNYTALFIAAAVFALLGAFFIQPIKGVR